MASERAKTIGGGCLGGPIGAFLGVVIGGFIGSAAHGKGSHPVEIGRDGGNYHELGAVLAAGLAEANAAIASIFLGAGIGGIIGGIGGSVLGAGLAAKPASKLAEQLPTVKGSTPIDESEPPTQSPDAELARLKDRVAELEAKKRKDDRFKEK